MGARRLREERRGKRREEKGREGKGRGRRDETRRDETSVGDQEREGVGDRECGDATVYGECVLRMYLRQPFTSCTSHSIIDHRSWQKPTTFVELWHCVLTTYKRTPHSAKGNLLEISTRSSGSTLESTPQKPTARSLIADAICLQQCRIRRRRFTLFTVGPMAAAGCRHFSVFSLVAFLFLRYCTSTSTQACKKVLVQYQLVPDAVRVRLLCLYFVQYEYKSTRGNQQRAGAATV